MNFPNTIIAISDISKWSLCAFKDFMYLFILFNYCLHKAYLQNRFSTELYTNINLLSPMSIYVPILIHFPKLFFFIFLLFNLCIYLLFDLNRNIGFIECCNLTCCIYKHH